MTYQIRDLTDEELSRLWAEIQNFPDYDDIEPMSLEEVDYWMYLYEEELKGNSIEYDGRYDD